MHRLTRAFAAGMLTVAFSGAVAPTAGAAPAPAAFCAKVKAYNKSIEAAARKNPRDRAALAALRAKGWAGLAKAAPANVAQGLQNMASAAKQGFPPAQADMAVVLPYIEQNCKVRLG